MNILLINPPIREWAKPNCFPVGLGYVAAVLRDAGHHVKVLDINANRYSREEVEEIIKTSMFEIVGVGGMITIYKYIKWLVSVLKKYHPNKYIIVGGSVSSSIPEILLENTETDIACIGEGENTIVDLIAALDSKKDISSVRGIYYKRNRQIFKTLPQTLLNMEDLPLPAYDLFPMEIYLNNIVGILNKKKWQGGDVSDASQIISFNISASRGCPYNCIFCYHDFMGTKYRCQSPEKVINHMKFLIEKYRVNYFLIQDDLFMANLKNFTEFCEKLIKEELNVQWQVPGRVNLITEELLLLMKKAGCIWCGFGFESGSQYMLDRMKKGTTVEQAKRAALLVKKHFGRTGGGSFVLGLPGESLRTIQDTIDFCKQLDFDPEVVFLATPYPGTELWDIASQKNMIRDKEAYILSLDEQGEQIVCNFTDFTNDELLMLRSYVIRSIGARNIDIHENHNKNGGDIKNKI